MRKSVLWPELFVLAILAGCAPSAPPVIAPQPATGAGPSGKATILSIRTVVSSAGSAPWRAALLAAAAHGDAGTTDHATPWMEFIVRTDDGTTLSIVQANELDFHTGDRVVIHYEPRTELARPG